MWISLGLAATLLINIPFLGNLDLRRMWRGHQAKSGVAADSLPPLWRHASRLALENEFVFSDLPTLSPQGSIGLPTGLRMTNDPRSLHVSVEPDSGTLVTSPIFGDVAVGPGVSQPLSDYGNQLTAQKFHDIWEQTSKDRINNLGENTPAPAGVQPGGGGVHLPLGKLPTPVASILGPGGPALNVRGSENIRISGTSSWTNQQVGQIGQKKSLFPTLDMQQDLDIQLEGQLSDRIRVNLLQNSANQIPLSNRIAINYRGDEDALFQQIDLGNTNLSLPGTQYVSYSGKNEGLFGMKATSRMGPLDFTLLASKQEGRSERAVYTGGSSSQQQLIRDLEYVRGVYFFIQDPNFGPYDIPDDSIKVYRDDGISTNDITTYRGTALPDPTQIATALSADSTRLGIGPVAIRGQFDKLNLGADRDYEVLSNIYGTGWKIIRLTQPLLSSQRLAVTYRRRPMQNGSGVGDYESIGGKFVTDVDGAQSLVMKLVRVAPDVIPHSDVSFDSTAALFPLRSWSCATSTSWRASASIPRRSSSRSGRVRSSRRRSRCRGPGRACPYIEVVGLDNIDESTGTPAPGHDNKVDQLLTSVLSRPFVDYENGTLMLPEPRPFAPRIGPNGKPFDLAVSNALNRRATLTGGQETETTPNPVIYDRYLPQPEDAGYFLLVEFTAARRRARSRSAAAICSRAARRSRSTGRCSSAAVTTTSTTTSGVWCSSASSARRTS
jgi:hypothetical protein